MGRTWQASWGWKGTGRSLCSLAVAPPALQQNAEFAALCPARAGCMTQVLVEWL